MQLFKSYETLSVSWLNMSNEAGRVKIALEIQCVSLFLRTDVYLSLRKVKKNKISIINKRSFFLSFLSLMASCLPYYNLNLDQVFLWGSGKTNLVHYKSFLYWLL